MKISRSFTLAIESAIAGGSLSLLEDGREVAAWVGDGGVSKAEDLLISIDALLSSNGVSRNEIGLIAVGAGPGSFTGIRIGIATALGLKNGLGIAMASESTLKAMALAHSSGGRVTAVLPMGRKAVCYQEFTNDGNVISSAGEPKIIPEEILTELIRDNAEALHILHPTLADHSGGHENAVVFPHNLASAIGLACESSRGIITAPIFLSKTF